MAAQENLMTRLKEELEEKDRLQNELNKANEQMEVMAVENDRLQEGIKTNGDQETEGHELNQNCLLYTSPSPRDA